MTIDRTKVKTKKLPTLDEAPWGTTSFYEVLMDGARIGRVARCETTVTHWKRGLCNGQKSAYRWFVVTDHGNRKRYGISLDGGKFRTKADAVERVCLDAEASQ